MSLLKKGIVSIFVVLTVLFTNPLSSLSSYEVNSPIQAINPKKQIVQLDKQYVRKTLNLPIAAFNPTFFEFKYKKSGNELTRQTDAKWMLCSFQAPVTLPDGAKLEEIIMYCMDPFRAINVDLFLRRCGNSNTEIEEIAKVNSYGSGDSIRRFQTSEFTNTIIDNMNYFYHLTVNLQGKLSFNGAKIIYSVLE